LTYGAKKWGEVGNSSGIRSGDELATTHVASTTVESIQWNIVSRSFTFSIRTICGICPGGVSILRRYRPLNSWFRLRSRVTAGAVKRVADLCVGVLRDDLVGGGFCVEAGIEATETEAGAGLAAAGVDREGVCTTTDRLTRGGVAPWGTFG